MNDTMAKGRNAADADLLAMLDTVEIAALGTLHRGDPAVSMVPFARLTGHGFVVHVSRLATHTADMQAHPAVALMVAAEPRAGEPAQSRARASVQGRARTLEPGEPLHAEARAAYLSRFPSSEPMFGFGDFSLVLIEPRALRHVGGFAQARTLVGTTLAALLAA